MNVERHPTDEQLVAFAAEEDVLDKHQRSQVARHLLTCKRCLRFIRQLEQAFEPAGSSAGTGSADWGDPEQAQQLHDRMWTAMEPQLKAIRAETTARWLERGVRAALRLLKMSHSWEDLATGLQQHVAENENGNGEVLRIPAAAGCCDETDLSGPEPAQGVVLEGLGGQLSVRFNLHTNCFELAATAEDPDLVLVLRASDGEKDRGSPVVAKFDREAVAEIDPEQVSVLLDDVTLE